MFRGSATAKIDDKGRLKLPSQFLSKLQELHGDGATAVFVTSTNGKSARIYPMPEWEKVEERLAQAPSSDRAVQSFLNWVSYYGQELSLGGQGRLLMPQLLREKAQITGEVMVFGRLRYLEVWNREHFEAQLEEQPLSEADQDHLAELGI
ncbi:MAG: division/cell wall cluster transcriptional repressor MraZ [Acidobacteriota bacterium]